MSLTSYLIDHLPEIALVAVLSPEFLSWRRDYLDRRARINLHLYEINPQEAKPIYGLEDIRSINDIEDIIHRISHPELYKKIRAGNEILIDGPAQSGKKSLAIDVAKRAGIDRIIIVDDLSDKDVTARLNDNIKKWFWRCVARGLTGRGFNSGKTMVLMAGIDRANGHKGYQAIIDTAESRPDVVIVSTSQEQDRIIADQHGTILHIPQKGSPEWQKMMHAVADGYLSAAEKSWDKDILTRLQNGSTREDIIRKVIEYAKSPGDIEDIVEHCVQRVIYEQHQVDLEHRQNLMNILEKIAIPRVTSERRAVTANQNQRPIRRWASRSTTRPYRRNHL